jgi:hypothetical protein
MGEDFQAERMKILEMIEAGDISPKDGLQLLEALTGEPSDIDDSDSDLKEL